LEVWCPTSNGEKSAGKFSSSNIRICRNSFVSGVEYRYCEFALYRWKLMKKLIDAFAAFKVIEQRSDRNAGTNKHKTTAEDVRVSVGDIGKRDHGAFPFRGSMILPQKPGVRKRAAISEPGMPGYGRLPPD
jgi:hypothetical protein